MAQIFTLYEPPQGAPWWLLLAYIFLFLFALLLPFLIRYLILRRPVINLWSAIPLALICSIIIGTSLYGLFMVEDELSDFERYVLSDPEFLKEELSDFHRYLLSDPKETGRPNLESLWYKYRLKEEIKQKEEKLKQRRENFRPFIMPIFVAALVYAYCIMHVGYRDYCIKRLIADETDKRKLEMKNKFIWLGVAIICAIFVAMGIYLGLRDSQPQPTSQPDVEIMAQELPGSCEVIDIVRLFVDGVHGWAQWDIGAQPGTPITWFTEGKYNDPPEDIGPVFGFFARHGKVVLTINGKPIYQQLKRTVVPGVWEIWLVGPNAGVLVVKIESEYGKELPFNVSEVLNVAGFKVILYKGLKVRNTTGNFIIYSIESPDGGKAWLAESWSIGTAGGSQEIWITYQQKDADTLWEKEGSLGKQHLLWKRQSDKAG